MALCRADSDPAGLASRTVHLLIGLDLNDGLFKKKLKPSAPSRIAGVQGFALRRMEQKQQNVKTESQSAVFVYYEYHYDSFYS